MDNDISLRSQIRTLRVLLLGTIIMFTLYAIIVKSLLLFKKRERLLSEFRSIVRK